MTSTVIEGAQKRTPYRPEPSAGAHPPRPRQAQRAGGTEGADPGVVAVVVTGDSPLAQAVEALEQLGTHLPGRDRLPASRDQPRTCTACRAPWPCQVFDAAARAVLAKGLRVFDVVPRDLHPLLVTPPAAQPPA